MSVWDLLEEGIEPALRKAEVWPRLSLAVAGLRMPARLLQKGFFFEHEECFWEVTSITRYGNYKGKGDEVCIRVKDWHDRPKCLWLYGDEEVLAL